MIKYLPKTCQKKYVYEHDDEIIKNSDYGHTKQTGIHAEANLKKITSHTIINQKKHPQLKKD